MSKGAKRLSTSRQISNNDIDLTETNKNRDLDWLDNLSNSAKNDIREGLNQLDQGRSFSHEEAKKRFGFK